jgi:hypothetical protein
LARFRIYFSICLLENVYLTNLPKGYYIALERRQRQYCIVGHPGGHRYSNAGKSRISVIIYVIYV